MDLQTRIRKIVEHIADGMHEREDIIAVALLGALSNQNTFLYGPPGTAKSLISRRIASAFKEPTYFECLMNRFSTPEELFGPVSIKELKEDRYIRKIDKYLPTAEFAFLDEIWKSSPAILNSLLTLINEGTYRNGTDIIKAPLKALIAASNETPEPNQGLDALYDRFTVRMIVEPIQNSDNFELLIHSKPIEVLTKLPENLIIKPSEWKRWSKKIHDVYLSAETLTIIHLIRLKLSERFEELGVYVSDRRWQKAAQFLKASAFFNGREVTNHSDALLLCYCLWTTEENFDEVEDIVDSSIKEVGFTSDIDIAELDIEKDALDKEINNELFHGIDIYDTRDINAIAHFKAVIDFEYEEYGYRRTKRSTQKTMYIKVEKMGTKGEFYPQDSKGNDLEGYQCDFDGQGTCNIKTEIDDQYESSANFTPVILFHKGTKKADVNKRLIAALKQSVVDIRLKLLKVAQESDNRSKELRSELVTVFFDDLVIDIPLQGIQEQRAAIEQRIKDCQRLEALCRG